MFDIFIKFFTVRRVAAALLCFVLCACSSAPPTKVVNYQYEIKNIALFVDGTFNGSRAVYEALEDALKAEGVTLNSPLISFKAEKSHFNANRKYLLTNNVNQYLILNWRGFVGYTQYKPSKYESFQVNQSRITQDAVWEAIFVDADRGRFPNNNSIFDPQLNVPIRLPNEAPSTFQVREAEWSRMLDQYIAKFPYGGTPTWIATTEPLYFGENCQSENYTPCATKLAKIIVSMLKQSDIIKKR
jgi:hypothetical protein